MEGLAQIQCHAELREKRVLTPFKTGAFNRSATHP
jgi:hypothetical protein